MVAAEAGGRGSGMQTTSPRLNSGTETKGTCNRSPSSPQSSGTRAPKSGRSERGETVFSCICVHSTSSVDSSVLSLASSPFPCPLTVLTGRRFWIDSPEPLCSHPCQASQHLSAAFSKDPKRESNG
ncbi:hypothetical protein HJG60_011278 [Phyllostomus discolor]|uniref:Uncharacterized protein n=1 Tax=Phyllostomus discolor TaxID=89673 RepID=A0A834A7J6_9CHIR|nr:hypothetical protein HJG60_011278 [Phyllostomus discolor]